MCAARPALPSRLACPCGNDLLSQLPWAASYIVVVVRCWLGGEVVRKGGVGGGGGGERGVMWVLVWGRVRSGPDDEGAAHYDSATDDA